MLRPLSREDGSVVYNFCWTSPAQSLSGQSPAGLNTIFYCLIRDSPNLEGQVPVFISPRNRVARLYPQVLGSLFVASYDSQGYGGGIPISIACRNRSLLPATSQHAHSWQWALLEPMAIYLLNVIYLCFFLSLILLIDNGGVSLYIYWCSLTTPYST
jgi:hypothetical protein